MKSHRSCNGCVQDGNCVFQRHDKVEMCADVSIGDKECPECGGRGYVRGTGLQQLHPTLGWTNMTKRCAKCRGSEDEGERWGG